MTIWIMALEPIETRYTGEWFEELPRLLRYSFPDQDIRTVSGELRNSETTPGAFLNFYATTVWKSTQIAGFAEYVNTGDVKKNDYVLFTDAWNPMILQIRYMSDLMNLDLKIGGIWHAGSYDPADFLGRASGGKDWVQCTEPALFNACDQNFFATEFHIRLFQKTYPGLGLPGNFHDVATKAQKAVRTGLPFQYWVDRLGLPVGNDFKKVNKIVFPHRIAPEKRIDVFYKLKDLLPEYEFVVCQEQKLTKEEYHNELRTAKIVFSANEQETLGISTCGEGPWFGAVPLCPDRLSYAEIFKDFPEFTYPVDFLEDRALLFLADRIRSIMNNFLPYQESVTAYRENRMREFFSSNEMFSAIRKAIS